MPALVANALRAKCDLERQPDACGTLGLVAINSDRPPSGQNVAPGGAAATAGRLTSEPPPCGSVVGASTWCSTGASKRWHRDEAVLAGVQEKMVEQVLPIAHDDGVAPDLVQAA
jgi:hypothetical protein